ncbi:MAG: class I tRNA ligase family protein, partial [Clostridia bacterium]|nr:class I tRNA ligase family protein [Clostridia bacterium]
VDLYTGGDEHVTRHMLYASFWHHFLYDINAVPFEFPFKKRLCNGLTLGADGNKMSKSLGNVVDPMSILEPYGADVFRLYMMFSGEYDQNTIWNEQGIKGCLKFVKNIWELQDLIKGEDVSKEHEVALNKLIKKCADGIENFTHNTSIAEMMIFVNKIKQDKFITKEELKQFLIAINPFAPYITSEMFEQIFNAQITEQIYPSYDENKLVDNEINLPVQVNGKLKFTIKIALNEDENAVKEKAKQQLQTKETGEIVKVIYVPNKIINFIIKK